MLRVAYIGFSADIVKALSRHPEIELQAAICEERYMSRKYQQTCQDCGCPFFVVRGIDALENRLEKGDLKIDCFVIYKTSIIISDRLLNRWPFYNLHSGDMRCNKGANPLAWNILLDEKSGKLVLHQIDNRIDQGLQLAYYTVPIHLEDTPATLEKRLEKGIPLLLNRLVSGYKTKFQGEPIGAGGYRRRVRPADYTIDLQKDTQRQIICKINSQKPYKGAILPCGEQEYRVFDYEVINGDKTLSTYEIEKGKIVLQQQRLILSIQ